jgi:hypothetical protein
MGRMGCTRETILSQWKTWSLADGHRENAENVSSACVAQSVR